MQKHPDESVAVEALLPGETRVLGSRSFTVATHG